MKTYLVTVSRTETRNHVFCVSAESREEAEELAIENSYDHDFREDRVVHADENVTSTTEV
jgi:hypothetical protein